MFVDAKAIASEPRQRHITHSITTSWLMVHSEAHRIIPTMLLWAQATATEQSLQSTSAKAQASATEPSLQCTNSKAQASATEPSLQSIG